jgi:hypothetical protein
MLNDLQSLLGTIVIVCGGLAGALSLIDWSLSSATKERIKDRSTRVWYWLSYQRTWPYVQTLQNPRSFDVFFGLGALLISGVFSGGFAYLLLIDPTPIALWMVPLALAAIPVGIYVTWRNSLRKLFGLVTKADSAWRMLLRIGAAYLWITLPIAAVIGLLTIFIALNLELANKWWMVIATVFIAVWLATYVSFFFLYGLIMLTVYIGMIYCLIVIFKIAEFVALKLAEYDKGPILATAAVVTAIGSILKTFSH